MTLIEVANYLKVAERTLYRLAASKKLPAFKIGGSWRFSRADLDDWIKKQSMSNLYNNAVTDVYSTGGKKGRGSK